MEGREPTKLAKRIRFLPGRPNRNYVPVRMDYGMSLRNSLDQFDSVQEYQEAPQGAFFIYGLKIMSDEKPIDLTDQFAMAALQILIRNDDAGSRNRFTICDDYISGWDALGNEVHKISEGSKEVMSRLAKVAYQMAREMRKARLAAFE